MHQKVRPHGHPSRDQRGSRQARGRGGGEDGIGESEPLETRVGIRAREKLDDSEFTVADRRGARGVDDHAEQARGYYVVGDRVRPQSATGLDIPDLERPAVELQIELRGHGVAGSGQSNRKGDGRPGYDQRLGRGEPEFGRQRPDAAEANAGQ